jgi:ClpP class serine protease
MNNNLHNPRCFHSHMGVWAVKPDVIESKHRAILDGHIVPKAMDNEGGNTGACEPERKTLAVSEGVAIISVDDVMMKKASKYGGVSTIDVRRQLREAISSAEVKSILLYIDSPGGHVEGQAGLVDEVRKSKTVKPVYAYIDDTGCSAAYWLAAACSEVACSRMAMVGNIGAYAVLHDTSEAYKAESHCCEKWREQRAWC